MSAAELAWDPGKVEELLAERSVTVDHITIYRWVQRFTPEFIEAARLCLMLRQSVVRR